MVEKLAARLKICTQQHEEALVVVLAGSADMAEAATLNQNFEKLLSGANYNVVVELSELYFTSSMGLSALLGARSRCEAKGGELVLVSPQPAVLKVLQTTKLDRLFRICDSVQEALQKMAKV